MIDLFDWPDFDKAEAFRFHKVVNEPDFLPVFFVRHLVEVAKLVRQHRGVLKATRLGRALVEEPRVQALLAILFHVTFWDCDLSYVCRGLHGSCQPPRRSAFSKPTLASSSGRFPSAPTTGDRRRC